MSDLFADREKGYEAKWVHDAEIRFKIMARRNVLLGRWAAGELGLSGDQADTYAKALMDAQVLTKNDGEDSVFAKLQGDFRDRKIALSDDALHRKMAEFFKAADIDVGKASSG